MIEDRKFVLDSEDTLQDATSESGRPYIDNVPHCPDNGIPFKEGEKENLTPATHSARARCNKPVTQIRKNAGDSETVKNVNLGIVSDSLTATDSLSDENARGLMSIGICGTDNSSLPANRYENISENNSASDVNLNKCFTPVPDVSACGVNVCCKSLSSGMCVVSVQAQ